MILIAAFGHWIKSIKSQMLHIPMESEGSAVPDVPGGDLRSLVVQALCEYVQQEVRLYSTVNSYLESRYSTPDARNKLTVDLRRLFVDVGGTLSDQLGRTTPLQTVHMLPTQPFLSKVQNVICADEGRDKLLGHHLPLWSLAFRTPAYFSGGEPTVHILRELEGKLLGGKAPKECVVSYHMAGLECGTELPPFGVHIVAGAGEVLHAFLVAHSLLHLREWPRIPDTLDLSAAILALLPHRLLELLRMPVLVAANERTRSPIAWTCLYLDHNGPHRPNPIQVLTAIQGVAALCPGDLPGAIRMVNSLPGRPGRAHEKRISTRMMDILELIWRGGEAFRGRLQAG